MAARPSVGKTTFALNLAARHCKQGQEAFVFSLEMGTKQLLQRMISTEGHINGQKWRSSAFSDEDYEQATQAVGEISSWRLDILDKKTTLHDIRHAIRKKIQATPDSHPLVIIDYLQLIIPNYKHERHDISLGEITRELKLLAIELEIPIILLSQLNRAVESRQDKRPLMSDLRGSGNIEQDADVVMFLYRDGYYNRDEEGSEDKIEIILSKHRNGPTGTVELGFVREFVH
ncbi:replicative DNA helicase [Salinibacillus xinjiangensis]|uniref:replicative DNA helicase n=1 Tax=Salinibacillus xinjiangensis TaxID=1229268 RepID=UPI00129BC24B|nr:DnaB-like helicase C-terminal domain-containing protein [Salinibacillus xinjiangensis]